MVENDALRAEVEAALTREQGRPIRVWALTRHTVVESASHAIERVDVRLDDGVTMSLALKHLGSPGLTDAGRRSRRDLVKDSRRESELYQVLQAAELDGVPRLRAASEVSRSDRPWLLVDWVDGTLLWRIADLDAWLATARWAARLHARFAEAPPRSLVVHDADWYRSWARRAEMLARGRPSAVQQQVERITSCYERAVERLVSLPRTLVHGELFPANVLAQRSASGWTTFVVDWESAAVDCGLTDLANLTAGGWSHTDRERLIAAYHTELSAALATGRPGQPLPWRTAPELAADLDWCRLQVAVQWLGWSEHHDGPPEQANDWLAEATALADRLGF